MSTTKVEKASKFMKYIKVPLWVLARIRDVYVLSMTHGNAMGCPTPQIPRSLSANSYCTSEQDLRKMIRSASTRNELRRSITLPPIRGGSVADVSPGDRVVIRRIDEEGICEMDGVDDVGLLKPKFYQKSRSYVVPGRSKME